MFGLGAPELILIFIVALVIFGPKKLPEIGRSVGKGLREFRNATSVVNKEVLGQEKLEHEKPEQEKNDD